MERVTRKHTFPCVKYIAYGSFLYSSRNSNRGSVSTYREKDGREVQEGGDICIPMADSC